MHRWNQIICPPVFSLRVFGCSSANGAKAASDEDVIVRKVKTATELCGGAVEAGDIDRYFSHYMADAVWHPPNFADITGADTVRARLSGLFDDLSVAGSWEIEEQIVMGLAWVAQRGQFRTVITPKAGWGEDLHEVGGFVNVRKKDAAGRWKITLDIWNSDRGVNLAQEPAD